MLCVCVCMCVCFEFSLTGEVYWVQEHVEEHRCLVTKSKINSPTKYDYSTRRIPRVTAKNSRVYETIDLWLYSKINALSVATKCRQTGFFYQKCKICGTIKSGDSDDVTGFSGASWRNSREKKQCPQHSTGQKNKQKNKGTTTQLWCINNQISILLTAL